MSNENKFTSISALKKTRKKLKQLALDMDMSMADLFDLLVDQAIERNKEAKSEVKQ